MDTPRRARATPHRTGTYVRPDRGSRRAPAAKLEGKGCSAEAEALAQAVLKTPSRGEVHELGMVAEDHEAGGVHAGLRRVEQPQARPVPPRGLARASARLLQPAVE